MTGENDPEDLRRRYARYVVSPELAHHFEQAAAGRVGSVEAPDDAPVRLRVIVELNADYPGGVAEARRAVLARMAEIGVDADRIGRCERRSGRYNLFAELDADECGRLGERPPDAPSGVYKLWRDQPLKPLLDRSIRTIKADACLTAYGADGEGIVVAVADSGIDGDHPHFAAHANLVPPAGLAHRDFTEGEAGGAAGPLVDAFGHGTHVAGIVAGQCDPATVEMVRLGDVRDAAGTVVATAAPLASRTLRGVAPRAKLLSLKVLDERGEGYASGLIAALEHVEELNDYGRRIRVHCVNLSLGYPFDAEWFAAGHSPLCAAVNRLSRSGTVVVAAAGNDGSAMIATEARSDRQRIGMDQSINDPGNAEEAITVGATHAEAPHRYGVSYFSSRGPTADGRVKPDLVAPGERILSCAAGGSTKLKQALKSAGEAARPDVAYYREESGTSMAAPHVAGAVAALLSIRSEFIGEAAAVKQVLLRNCVDLKRKADFQGAGLLDLMRAIQAI